MFQIKKSMMCLGLAAMLFSRLASAEFLLPQFPVTKFKLKNGLTILLSEDHSVPMIAYHTWYKVGSKDEHRGITGSAHMLEHMMFKGAHKYSGADFDRIIHENGMVDNAFTSYDYTGFYQTLPSAKLELMIDVEIDRMSSLALNESDLKSELQVVAEERRWRIDNSPSGVAREKLMQTAFQTGPYSWPVIGWMTDIQAYKVPPLRYFYDSFYGPNNAVLVLVGDFDAKETQKLIENKYGALAERPVPARNYAEEKEQTAERNATVKKAVQAPIINIAYKAPNVDGADVAQLDLLAGVLGDGTSSRLYQRLVYKDQLATSVSVSNNSMALYGLFSINIGLKPGSSVKKILEATKHEIWKLRKDKISEKELQLAQMSSYKDFLGGIKTMDGKARALAVNEILFSDYTRLFTDFKKYEKVSVNDIKQVATKYLVPEHRTVVVLEPTKKGAQ